MLPRSPEPEIGSGASSAPVGVRTETIEEIPREKSNGWFSGWLRFGFLNPSRNIGAEDLRRPLMGEGDVELNGVAKPA